MKKRIGSVLLALCLLLGLFPAALATEGDVAESNGVGYPTVQAAVDAAKVGEETTVKLLSPVTLDAALTISAGKKIVLDLNGSTLSAAANGTHVISNSGTLTVKSGTVAAFDAGAGTNGMAVVNQTGASLTVAQDEGKTTKLIGRSAIENYGVVIVNGGTVESYNRNAYWGASSGSTLTVNDGTFTSPSGSSGYGRAISSEGDVTIHGGSFYAGGSSGGGDNFVNAIGMFNSATLIVEPANGKNVTVTSETDYAVSSYGGAKVYIRGGTFACNGSRADVLILQKENTSLIEISGGAFRHEPYAEYLADNHIALEENGSYVVKAVKTPADAAVNSYAELANVLGGSILEPKNITLGADMTIPAGADLDLQRGYTLTVPAGVMLTVDGILRLNGTMTNGGTLTVGDSGFIEHPLRLSSQGTITGLPQDMSAEYVVSTPMQLQWLSYMVEQGAFPVNTRLACDLAMPAGVSFTPIGNSKFYADATFDGGNHTISNLNVEVTTEYKGGLFGFVGGGTIKNLTISGASTGSTSGYIGALIGYIDGNCTVQNVHIKDYTVESLISYGVGGFVGQIGSQTPCRIEFIGCTAENLNVSGYANVGGIWGTSTGATATIGIYNCALSGTVNTIEVNGGICGGFGSSAPVEIIGLDHSDLTATVKGVGTDELVAYTEVSNKNNLKPEKDAVKADGRWTAADTGTVAALVDGIPYTSFAAAIAAAQDGSLVSVKRDVTLTEAVTISANIEVTGFAGVSVGAGGSLTISAGTYDADPTPYVSADRAAKSNGDGTYTVVPLSAENAVASIGSNYYHSLTAALSAAQDGQTVKLLAASTGNTSVQIEDGRKITLDMNGFDAGFAQRNNIKIFHGELNLTGSGRLYEQEPVLAPVILYGAETDTEDYTVVTVGKDVTLEGRAGMFIDYHDGHGATAYGIRVTVYGTLKSPKGSNGHGFYVNGTIQATDGHVPHIMLDGAVLNAEGGNGMYLAGYAETDVINAKLTADTGVEIRAGKLNISGDSEITALATPTSVLPNGNGSTTKGAGLAVAQHTTKLPIAVTISGGTISGFTGLYESNPQHNSPEDIAKVTLSVSGGKFRAMNGGTNAVYSEDCTAFISGGAFTSNPGAYVAEGYGAMNETQVMDGVTYYYTVAQRAEELDVETAVSAGAPSVAVDEELGLPENFDAGLTDALKDEDTAKDLTDAAVGLSNDAGVVGTEEAAEKALTDAGISIGEGTAVTVVVEPYLKVEVTGYDGAEKTLTLEIGAYYNVKATTDPDSMTDTNTVSLREGAVMNVTTPVDITIPLPDDFTESTELYVKHVKDSGKTYYHLGTVSEDQTSLTFTNTKGFSTFTVSAGVWPDARIGDVGYATLQEAVDEVADGQTIRLLKDDLSATVAREVSFRVDENSHIGLTLHAGSGYSKAVAGDVYTFTYVGGGSSGIATYPVTVEKADNGTLSASPGNASKGSTVTLTVKPDEGYVLDTLTVIDKDGKEVELTEVNDSKYTFRMPASKVTVKAVFVKETLPFTDVAEDAWYYDAVAYVYEKGIMSGTNDGTAFSPAQNLTRGMMARILYNLENGKAGADNAFTDVADGAWYADAVNWAAANGIVSGYGNSKFGPEDPITREQMALILYNYAKFKGEDMTASADLTSFADGERVSDWAEYAMKWAVAEKLIQGSNNSLNPMGTATRAEVAQLFMNLLEQK